MRSSSAALVLSVDDPRVSSVARRLFPESKHVSLTASALRPQEPFRGTLFDLFASLPAETCVGVVLPLTASDAVPVSGGLELIAVTDHVNVSLGSPLAGNWPSGMPRTFPPMAGIYQPRVVSLRRGAQVYSAGVVAGVTDAGSLTPFESAVVRSRRYGYVSDMLVPIAVVAAYYGLMLAACGVVQAGKRDEQ